MFGPKKISQSLIDAVLKITEEKPEVTRAPQLLDEADKVPTPTGMKVYGSRYGNSAKARRDQTKAAVDTLKGPKDKELIKDDEIDETGFHAAAHGAKKAGQSHFEFQGKKYPVTAKSHAEAIEEDGDCVTKPQAKDIAKKEVGKHEKGMHGKSGEVAKHEKKMHKEDIGLDEASTYKLGRADAETKEFPIKQNGEHVGRLEFHVSAGKLHHRAGNAKGVSYDKWHGNPDTESLINTHVAKHEAEARKHFAKKLKEGMSFKERLLEREMTSAESRKKEKIVMSMKDKQEYFKKKYGKKWKEVMYATATKQAMKEDIVSEEVLDLPIDPLTGEFVNDRELISSSYNEKLKNGQMVMIEEGVEELDEFTARQLPGYREKKAKLMAAAASKLPTKEEVKKSDVPAFLRKIRGDKPLTMKDVKSGDKDSISHKDNLAKAKNEEVESLDEDNLDSIAKKHGMEFNRTTYGAGMKHPKHGEISISRYGEWHHYPAGSNRSKAHGDSTDKFSSLDKHLSSLKEDVEVINNKNGHKTTTDMLSGRHEGGKLNSFKNFKVNLVVSGEEEIPTEVDKGEDTKEKQKITTNPGPVDIKFDDKLVTPPHKYFSSQSAVTSEEVRGELKKIRTKEKAIHNKEVSKFASHKATKTTQTEEEVQEAKDPHMDAGVGAQPDFATEKVIAGTEGWKKVTKNVTDKSGAVHTPHSRAKDLARQAFKKVKSEMLGKAPGNN